MLFFQLNHFQPAAEEGQNTNFIWMYYKFIHFQCTLKNWTVFYTVVIKPCHLDIHWIALTEYYQMNTHLLGFQ